MEVSMKQLQATGHLCLAQATIGVSIICSKLLVPHVPIILLLLIRFGFGSILLLGLCAIYKKNITLNRDGGKLTRHDYTMISLQSVCGGFLFNILMLFGLVYTDATAAGIITSATPAMILILSLWLLKETLTHRKIFTVVLAILGIILMHLGEVGDKHTASNLWGNFLVLLSIIPEAMFTIIAKKHKTQLNPLVTATLCNIVNTIIILPIALTIIPTISTTHLVLSDWLILSILAISSMLFFSFWYKGIPHVPASYAALMTAVAPISITGLAAVFLGESLTTVSALGMGLILLSIFYGSGVKIKTLVKKGTTPAA
jgi:drug/metabolite transporter (DMT)-like permease